jgi:acyl-CoA reductase-like NAD-dependent aldehyde dehydrogenase
MFHEVEKVNQRTMDSRIKVLKTYKLYIDGKFPRTESGRYFIQHNTQGEPLANLCQASKKDLRDAVVAARKAHGPWASRSAYNKGQILYRIAEMLEGRKSQFISELQEQGLDATAAGRELHVAVDRLVYYAGWCDKYQQVFSAVNPVESSHFNFSLPEPTGVVTALAPRDSGLAGLISVVAPAIAGGNTVIVLASEAFPLTAITFAEVLHTSDLPPGVVNILTGFISELAESFANHMDVNACVYCGQDTGWIKVIEEQSAVNVKRPVILREKNWLNEAAQSPYRIMELQEIKTTWHPIGQ